MSARFYFIARCLAAAAALPLLAGCPGLEHLIDPSSVNRVTVEPNPVPAPAASNAQPFNVRVEFDSVHDNDRLRILMRDPHDSDRFRVIGEPEPCPGRRSGGGCGNGTILVSCNVQDSPFAGERSVGCGTSRVDVGTGDRTLRVEISSDYSFGVDDKYDATITLQ